MIPVFLCGVLLAFGSFAAAWLSGMSWWLLLLSLAGTGLFGGAALYTLRGHRPVRVAEMRATLEPVEHPLPMASQWLAVALGAAWLGLFAARTLMRPDGMRDGGWVVLAVLGIPLLLLVWRALPFTLGFLRFGRVRIEFDGWPLRVGSVMRGHVVIERGARGLQEVRVKLVLVRRTNSIVKSEYAKKLPAHIGPPRGHVHHEIRDTDLWSEETTVVQSPQAPVFTFAMSIPPDKPATQEDLGTNTSHHFWRIEVTTGAGSRARLRRTFSPPVRGADW